MVKMSMCDQVYYGGELIKSVSEKPSKDKQWWLLENHPCFTLMCARCGYQFPRFPQNWNCPKCGCSYE